MVTVYKYKLDKNTQHAQRIIMPRDAQIIGFDEDKNSVNVEGDLCLWAKVDTNKDEEIRYFYVFWTGTPINKSIEARDKKKALLPCGGCWLGGMRYHLFEAINSYVSTYNNGGNLWLNNNPVITPYTSPIYYRGIGSTGLSSKAIDSSCVNSVTLNSAEIESYNGVVDIPDKSELNKSEIVCGNAEITE